MLFGARGLQKMPRKRSRVRLPPGHTYLAHLFDIDDDEHEEDYKDEDDEDDEDDGDNGDNKIDKNKYKKD